MTIVVSDRLNKALVKINGVACRRCKARKRTICAHSGRAIRVGDMVYRPIIANDTGRMKRWLASVIEDLEEEQNEQAKARLTAATRPRDRSFNPKTTDDY